MMAPGYRSRSSSSSAAMSSTASAESGLTWSIPSPTHQVATHQLDVTNYFQIPNARLM